MSGKMIKGYAEERDLNLFADGSIDCLTLWPEKDRKDDDIALVPFSEVMKERARCIEAFRCFDYDYAVEFIRSDSVIIDRK